MQRLFQAVVGSAFVALSLIVVVPSVAAQTCTQDGSSVTTCVYNSTQSTCTAPVVGGGQNCALISSTHRYASSTNNCVLDPRECASNQRLNCATMLCECNTAAFPCGGCTAATSTAGTACSGASCPTGGVYTNQCGATGCPAGTTNISGVCVGYANISPASPQTGYLSVTGDIRSSGGDYYMQPGKAIRMDGMGLPTLNIGNWDPDGLGVRLSLPTGGQIVLGASASEYIAGASPNGAMYYNSTTNKFRCRENAVWVDCVGGAALPVGTDGQMLRSLGGAWYPSSVITNNGANIGINIATPSYQLDVNGTARVFGFVFPPDAAAGRVLTSDANGNASWQAPTGGGLPTGTSGQTLRYDGTAWVANSLVTNNGTNVGINTVPTAYRLDVNGPLNISGGNPLRIGGAWVASYNGAQEITVGSNAIESLKLDTTAGSDVYVNAGNVGIGTASPSEMLHLSSAGSPSILVGNTDDRGAAVLTLSRGYADRDRSGVQFGENDNPSRYFAGIPYNCGSVYNNFVIATQDYVNNCSGTTHTAEFILNATGVTVNGAVTASGDITANGVLYGMAGMVTTDVGIWGVLNTLGDVSLRNGNFRVFEGNARFGEARANDTTYEWFGWYSGSTRQAILIYDGSWDSCSSDTTVCLKAENGNNLRLKADGGTVLLDGNVAVGNALNVGGGGVALTGSSVMVNTSGGYIGVYRNAYGAALTANNAYSSSGTCSLGGINYAMTCTGNSGSYGAASFSGAHGTTAYLAGSAAGAFYNSTAYRYGVYVSDSAGLGAVYIGQGQAYKPGGGSWASTSDARTKKDVSGFEDGLGVIRALRPVNYTYNGLGDTPAGERGIGLIAQEAKEVAPYLVKSQERKLRESDAEPTEVFYLDPSAIPFINLNAIKELDTRVRLLEDGSAAELDGRVQQLEDRVDRLERELMELRSRE